MDSKAGGVEAVSAGQLSPEQRKARRGGLEAVGTCHRAEGLGRARADLTFEKEDSIGITAGAPEDSRDGYNDAEGAEAHSDIDLVTGGCVKADQDGADVVAICE